MLKKIATISAAALLATGGAVTYASGAFDEAGQQATVHEGKRPKVGPAPTGEKQGDAFVGGAAQDANGAVPATIQTNGDNANVRSGPGTDHAVTRTLANQSPITILCQTEGPSVDGYWGPTTIWDKIGENEYVTDGLVYTGSDDYVAPKCEDGGTPPPAPAGDGFAVQNNYPYADEPNPDAEDPWLFYKRQCTSWAAFALRDRLKIDFTNYYKDVQWGHANHWDDAARSVGVPVHDTPKAGDIAQSDAGGYGHVAFVAKVNADGSYVIEEYNWNNNRSYNTRTIQPGEGYFTHFIRFQ